MRLGQPLRAVHSTAHLPQILAGRRAAASRPGHRRGMHLPTPLPLLDPDRLDRLSRELADAAGELAGLRSALRARAGDLHWHSPAARAFAAVLHELLGQLGQSGTRLSRAGRRRPGPPAAGRRPGRRAGPGRAPRPGGASSGRSGCRERSRHRGHRPGRQRLDRRRLRAARRVRHGAGRRHRPDHQGVAAAGPVPDRARDDQRRPARPGRAARIVALAGGSDGRGSRGPGRLPVDRGRPATGRRLLPGRRRAGPAAGAGAGRRAAAATRTGAADRRCPVGPAAPGCRPGSPPTRSWPTWRWAGHHRRYRRGAAARPRRPVGPACWPTGFADGTPVVSARPDLPTGDGAGPPRGAADLVRALALRGAHNDGGGAVDVRILDGPAGRRVIVDITGTTVWNLDPRRRTPQVSDLGTNLRALANRSSVFERGVLQALRQAGVRPGEPIMLVGHSQGGMIAARLAGQLRTEAGFTVTHLVTAGSPLGLAPVPGSVSVLSLQNTGDLVPELDGADNPRRGNWITVRTAHGDSSVLGRHSVQAYLAGAGDLDASTDRSLVQLAPLGGRLSHRRPGQHPGLPDPARAVTIPGPPDQSGGTTDRQPGWTCGAVASTARVQHDQAMLGLMQDFPLTIDYILRRRRADVSRPERHHPAGRGPGTDQLRRAGGAVAAGGRRARPAGRLRRTAGSARSAGTPPTTPPCTSGCRAPGGCCTPSTSGSFPSSWSTPSSTPRTRSSSWTGRCCRCSASTCPSSSTVRHVVVFDDGAPAPLPEDPRVLRWQDVAGDELDFTGMVTDEQTAAALCYTTGTTGNPKGVLYSHRSTYLHALITQVPGTFAINDADIAMPVVPMFHAMAWGLPYAGVMAGASLVLPGPGMTPAALLDLLETERVTLTAGVPTIWMGMLPLLAGRDLSALRSVICGGSAVPKALSEGWRAGDRAADHPGLGHDRALAAGHGVLDARRACRAARGAEGRHPHHRGDSAGRGRDADRRSRDPRGAALGRPGHRRAGDPRPVDRPAVLPHRRARRAVLRRRLAAHRRCRGDLGAGLSAGWSTAPRT